MTTVLVGGALANRYLNAGGAWVRLSWVVGLRQLGFRVYFIEQISRDACVDAAGSIASFQESVNLAWFKQITEQFGLADSAILIHENGDQVHGMAYSELLELAESADLLVNITGHLTHKPLLERVPLRAYIDLDPGFTQFWHVTGAGDLGLSDHDIFFTIGENIGRAGCSIPLGGVEWRPIRQPVVLEQWPVSQAGDPARFTTVASWRGSYGRVELHGRTFGLKVHEFRKFIALPTRTPQTFEIALDIHPADEEDINLLRGHGWQLVDPRVVVPEPSDFRRYVQTSGAEFSVAQGIYVETESGWVSDRTIRYLASGKPALVQDTGFSRNYPVDGGFVPFRTLEEAVSGAAEIMRDYDRHCRAARLLAEEFFDSDKVLGRLIEEVGVTP